MKQLLPFPLRLSLVSVPPITIDLFRFLFFAFSLAGISACAWLLGVNVPMVHLEVFVLAPFLHTRSGAVVSLIAVAIELGRVVEAVFGFDQLFVAIFLLLRNLGSFPLPIAVLTVFAIFVLVVLVCVAYGYLPRKRVAVSWLTLLLLAVVLPSLKWAEDFTKVNLVGSSFGYLIGQMRFSNMFTDRYTTPGEVSRQYPGSRGAEVAKRLQANYWLVVVESMGSPVNPEIEADMLSPFLSQALAARYQVELGHVGSLGSTIHGELRQLCNGRLQDGLFGSRNEHCIPHILGKEGYRTIAVHANKASTYGRSTWYPKIGFQEMVSSDSGLLPSAEVTGRWGTLDDISTIRWTDANRLNADKSFVYLLTVSTHLPASALYEARVSEDCKQRLGEQPCIHIANLHAVLGEIARAAEHQRHTVVVVVGDHPPPFFRPSSAAVFDKVKVPYIMLTPKQAEGQH